MNLSDFWYAVAGSREVGRNRLVGRTLLGERLALFRRGDGRAVALQNRCLHRNAPLSAGRLDGDSIVCGYHGWRYDASGRLLEIPSQPDPSAVGRRCVPEFAVAEKQGYVYVRLAAEPSEDHEPFAIPMLDTRGWKHIRLVHRFRNNVTNCAENFVDVPHTAHVHPTTFRSARRQQIEAIVVRENGSVTATYENETHLGAFRWFLNPSGRPTQHVDRFIMPNVTSVEYRFSPNRRLFITSQSVPVRRDETTVFTDLTFDYGIWSALATPFVRRQAKKIIAEDVAILDAQMEVIETYGEKFSNSAADIVHIFIESIRRELDEGRDPRRLPRESRTLQIVV